MELPKQFDNITSRVIDDLKITLQRGSKVSMAAASFSIYAFEALQKELEKVDELRFIFTSPTFNKEQAKKQKREFYIPKLNRERTLYGSDFEIKLRNNLTQRAIAKESADWIRQKVRFKANVSNMLMLGFLNVQNEEGLNTYMPFNEFTTTELGCERGNNIFQLIQRMPSPMSDAYLKNFNDFWQDKENFADVTDAIIENIENVYRENAPDFIYFVTLYNIFNEFLEDISEDVLPNEATGFKSSQIWNKLYNFQKDAALAIINKLETYNGCILADIELDDYLRLKGRVEARMAGMDITGAGSGNVLLSNEEQADLDYRKQQLERLQEEVVDIEDMDTGINIMDLGLNEFRLDLLAYMKDNPDIEHTPYGMSAVVPATEVAKPGVIFILKNRNNAVNINHQNLQHPFYMVYLSDEGETIINHLSPKRLLDIMRLTCKGRTEPVLDLCHAFNKETKDGKQMQHYSELLQQAVATIVEKKEESDLESLFSFGETTALLGDISGLDDFELICFLVIKEGADGEST